MTNTSVSASSFITLSPGSQELIIGKAAKWLTYSEIKYLVGAFNIHNKSSSPDKITTSALLVIPAFFQNVLRNLVGNREWQISFLKARFIEVVATKDFQVSRGLIFDSFVTECFLTSELWEFNSAIYNAAENDHFEVVGSLLMFNRFISERVRPRAVQSAAGAGSLTTLRLLLRSFALNEHDRGWAVILATRNRHSVVVRELMHNNAAISIGYRGEALRAAARNGDLGIVRELMQNNAVISNDDRGEAVGAAAQNGHLKIVQELDNQEMSENFRGSAVMNAAEGGHAAIIKLLLSHGTITVENRGIALQFASHGYFEAVCELNDAAVPQEDLKQAVRVSAEKGYYNIVCELLKNAEHLRAEAVQLAAKGGHLETILKLLDNHSISENDLKKAVCYAIGTDRRPVVRELSKRVVFTEEERGLNVEGAAISGHLELVLELLQCGTISEGLRGFAMKMAAEQGHAAIVRVLLDSGSISEHDRGVAAREAAEKGYLEVVQEILKDSMISPGFRRQATDRAENNGHTAIVQVLSKDPTSLN